MPTRESILREKTFKDEGWDVARRVSETLWGGDQDEVSLRLQRTAKLLGLLIADLHQTGNLGPDKLDDLLFDAIH